MDAAEAKKPPMWMSRMGPHTGAFRYGRHFCLLACAVPVLALASPWRPHGPVLGSGVYGALHAALLVLCLRASGTLARKLTFVALGAGVTMGSVVFAVNLSRFVAPSAFVLKPILLLALVSCLGASTYGLLVRRWWLPRLPFRALPPLALGCAVATTTVFSMVPSAHALGGLGVAATWWFAFSSVLCVCDLRMDR